MRLPDGSVLMHEGRPYDPQKAHEYYMRTRKLKGRRKGAGHAPSDSLRKSRADAAAQVARLQKKLSQLKAILRKRLAEEKKDARESEKKAKKGPTAAEKREKAKDSEKYRDKHKQELKTKAKKAAAKSGGGSKKKSSSGKAKKASVEDIKRTINVVEQRLAAATARKRALG